MSAAPVRSLPAWRICMTSSRPHPCPGGPRPRAGMWWAVWPWYWLYGLAGVGGDTGRPRHTGARPSRSCRRLKARTATTRSACQPCKLPALVKRTALAAFPRQAVASLSGTAWLEFLDHTGHTHAFTHGRGQLLPALSYEPHTASRLDAQDIEELLSIVSSWIRRHSIAPESP